VILGIDFDRVLFNTDEFDQYMRDNVDELEHVEDPEPLDENGNYDPERHAEILGFNPEKIYNILHDLEKFIYSDVEALDRLPEDVEKLIVTRGNLRFQSTKIENSGVLEHVDDYVVVEEGSKDVENIDFLVDDRKREHDQVSTPGMLFDRSKHSMEDVVEKVRKLNETRSSI